MLVRTVSTTPVQPRPLCLLHLDQLAEADLGTLPDLKRVGFQILRDMYSKVVEPWLGKYDEKAQERCRAAAGLWPG